MTFKCLAKKFFGFSVRSCCVEEIYAEIERSRDEGLSTLIIYARFLTELGWSAGAVAQE